MRLLRQTSPVPLSIQTLVGRYQGRDIRSVDWTRQVRPRAALAWRRTYTRC